MDALHVEVVPNQALCFTLGPWRTHFFCAAEGPISRDMYLNVWLEREHERLSRLLDPLSATLILHLVTDLIADYWHSPEAFKGATHEL